MGSSHDSAFLLAPANEVCEGNVFIGVCLSTRGVSVQGVSVQWVSVQWVSVHGGLCPWESLSMGVSVQGVSVQGGLCLRGWGSLPRGVSVQMVFVHGGLYPWGVSVQEGLCPGWWGSMFKGSLCQGDPFYCKVRGVRILLECILVFGKF